MQQRTAVLQRFLYTFIRVLPDLDAKLQAECVPFLSGLLAATPGELHAIGRDVARVLQPSIAQHASLKAIFESLPVSVYQRQTSSDMLQSRLTPDMEVKISFILNQVYTCPVRRMSFHSAYSGPVRFLLACNSDTCPGLR